MVRIGVLWAGIWVRMCIPLVGFLVGELPLRELIWSWSWLRTAGFYAAVQICSDKEVEAATRKMVIAGPEGQLWNEGLKLFAENDLRIFVTAEAKRGDELAIAAIKRAAALQAVVEKERPQSTQGLANQD